MVEGKRDSCEKVCKGDLERLKAGLEEASTCYLIGVLTDTDCEPCRFDVNALPSRQRIVKAHEVGDKLEKTFVRSNILSKLDDKLDCSHVPGSDNCKEFISTRLMIDKKDAMKLKRTRVNKANARSGMTKENAG